MYSSLLSLLLTGSGCSLYRIPTTPIKPTVVTRAAVEDPTAARSDDEGPESTDAPSLDKAPILVDAEETLRTYQENILLVGEALLTLELVEHGALDESERRIEALAQSFPEKESALLIRTLLSHWLLRARTASGDAPGEFAPETHMEALVQDLETVEKTVTSLKREGLDFYSRGDLGGALTCWRRILELAPADTETRQFLQRAEAILKNRRA